MPRARSHRLAPGLPKTLRGVFAALAVASAASAPLHAATITVDTDAVAVNAGDGLCSLKEAITNANDDVDASGGDCTAGSGTDTIEFDLPVPPEGPARIVFTEAMPQITDPVTVDGTTQSGNTGVCTTSIPDRPDYGLVFEGYNDGVTEVGNGLLLMPGSSGSTVKGISFQRFGNIAIAIRGDSAGNVVECNFLGTDETGTSTEDDGTGHGIQINGFGGGFPTDSIIRNNLISGQAIGLRIRGTDASSISGHEIVGNFFGTDKTGTSAIPNGYGIRDEGSGSQKIGTAISGNLIAASTVAGISTSGTGSVIQNNLIGTDVSGKAALPNAVGILASGADLEIGAATGQNVISGNIGDGIFLASTATGTKVLNNLIGVDSTGTTALANGGYGVQVEAAGNFVGRGGDDPRNVISGNTLDGVRLTSTASGNRVQDNFIGVDSTGAAALANGGYGVRVEGPDNALGQGGALGDPVEVDLDKGNVISGNTSGGVLITGSSATGNAVHYGVIGLDAGQTTAIPNSGPGITVSEGALDTEIGRGRTSGNVIGGNTGPGILVSNVETTSNTDQTGISGNFIGTDKPGSTQQFGNGSHGILWTGGSRRGYVGVLVGAVGTDYRNTIAYNAGDGVAVDGTSFELTIENNVMFGNTGLGIDLGDDGPTANDPGDPDGGANTLQNYPEFSAEIDCAGDLTVTYSLDSDAARTTPHSVDFYLADADGEEGLAHVGRAQYRHTYPATRTTNFGNAAALGVSVGDLLVGASGTDAWALNTSEFSPPVAVGQNGDWSVSTADELAACLTVANASTNPAHVPITLSADIDLTTLTTSPLPTIVAPIAIEGAGFAIDGGGAVRIFSVGPTGDFSVHDATLRNGTSAGDGSNGGGALFNAGITSVTSVTLSANTAPSLDGGGAVWNDHGASFTATDSTFSGNSAGFAGAVLNGFMSAMTLTNSTFAGNSAGQAGAVVNWSGATMFVRNSTFSGNSATEYGAALTNFGPAPGTTLIATSNTFFDNTSTDGALYSNAGAVHLAGNLLVGGDSGENCFSDGGTLHDNGYNLSDDASCGFSGTSADDATLNLGPLTDNGGPTATHLPAFPSDAIGAIPNGTVITNDSVSWTCDRISTDQRGLPRPIATGDTCTVGSVEVATVCPSWTVTTADELFDCIAVANGNGAGLDTITLGGDIPLTTLTTSPLPQITSEITLEGAGFAIDGGWEGTGSGTGIRIFDVGPTGDFTVHESTLRNGYAGFAEDGGAIVSLGAVSVTNSTLSGNAASNGGAIANVGTLTVTDSTFSGNGAGFGGAIHNRGTVTMTSNTFSENFAIRGGGIYNRIPEAVSYLAGNLFLAGMDGENCFSVVGPGTFPDNGYNISDDATCVADGTGSVADATPNLGLLADHGGPTATHMPAYPSDALNAIPNGTTVSNNGVAWTCGDDPASTDQRGLDRPVLSGEDCTAGAVETVVCTTVASGPWSDGATWSCGAAPADYDSTIVSGGHTVSIGKSTSLDRTSSLTIRNGGVLELWGDLTSSGDVDNSGDLQDWCGTLSATVGGNTPSDYCGSLTTVVVDETNSGTPFVLHLSSSRPEEIPTGSVPFADPGDDSEIFFDVTSGNAILARTEVLPPGFVLKDLGAATAAAPTFSLNSHQVQFDLPPGEDAVLTFTFGPAGSVVTPGADLEVDENDLSDSATWDVAIDGYTAVGTAVAVDLATDGQCIVTSPFSGTSGRLTFSDPVPQAVTVIAVDDGTAEGGAHDCVVTQTVHAGDTTDDAWDGVMFEDVTVTVLEDSVAPAVAGVDSVAATEDHRITASERVWVPVTQLAVLFTEEVSGGDLTSSFLVVGAGADGVFSTTDCDAALGGDDIEVPVLAVVSDPTTSHLDLTSGPALDAGWYRLLACATAITDVAGIELDGNGDGTAGDDFSLDFHIVATDLVDNPNFDEDLAPWTSDGFVWLGEDLDDAPTSGAADILLPDSDQVLWHPCVELPETATGIRGGFAVRIVDPTLGTPSVSLSFELFDGVACTGASVGTVSTLSVTGNTGAVWVEAESLVEIPGPAVSVRPAVRYTADGASPNEVAVDRIDVRGEALIFFDGFESGNTSSWSTTIP